MKKIHLTLILVTFSLFAFSQNINFDSIKINVQSENSNLYYEKLMYKFKFDPTSMSDEEVKNLYYGKKFSKYKTAFFDTDYFDFTKNFSQGNLKKAIISGEKYLEKDPTNSEVLTYLEIAYRKKDKESKNHILYSLQSKTLLNCIMKNGDGKTKETAFKVNSVGEEYLIAGKLGKNIRTFKRTSIMQNDGTIDGFSKGNEAIYFKVYESIENF
ncbi:protein of unknown function [Chryseobacterium piscicola]|uniref:DUF4919 domain-containing protein n=1 Tax=Chryseobacterium piscicola TaxID=551459 RepID=A0A1N7PJH4_9FLAO|nr:DUF4919 domain-containing protein [Chryseobacterium piscicola]PQA90030.1 hypothetical protein B0A70_15280 [Chryseobacterium piscicola]SIT10741.1 protein of unknown function [Chryseobacterium piscicola]